MRKIFGKADDFYRARIMTLEEEMFPDFDWRDDILYRSPSKQHSEMRKQYCLQIVDLDTKKGQIIKRYTNRKEADKALKMIDHDLKELTKIEFEEKYVSCRQAEDAPTEIEKNPSCGETTKRADNEGEHTNVPRNLL